MAYALLVAQTLVFVAGMALLGQLLVGAFNWPRRHENLVYRLFEIIASPVVKLVRWVTPRVVLDKHVPIGAFMLLLFAYFVLGMEHRDVCRADSSQAGCEKWAAAWNPGSVRQ
jgi:uncharacterized protein YggT (Ycf19 family)